MKTPLFLSLFLTAAFSVWAADPPAQVQSERPTLVIRKNPSPITSARLTEMGVTDGEVRLVISVDSAGKLSDWLVVGYTHPGLADAVVTAVKRWEFEPPRLRGEPVSVQREIQFRFESHGAIVSIDTASYIEAYLAQRFPDRYVFRPCSLKDLDRIPTPLNAPAPALSTAKRQAINGESHVTVDFFIDPSGVARMPSVQTTDDPELAAASVQAVRDWRFEPPTERGRPTLVHVQQTFRFGK